MNKSVMLTAVAAFAAGSLAAAPAPKTAAPNAAKPAAVKAAPDKLWDFLPPVVAEVGGKKVTRDAFVKFFMAQMPNGKLPPMITSEMLKQAAPRLVKSYVDRELVLAAAVKAGYKPSQQLAEASMRRQMKDASKEELEMFKRQLAMNNKTVDSFIKEEAAKSAVQENAAAGEYLEKKVFAQVAVPAAEARTFYDKNKAAFKVPGDAANTVRASHILIKEDKPEARNAALAKIEKIAAQLKKNPADFEKIAAAESGCPSGKMNKGSLGAFGKGQMVPEFEKAAFELKEGQISGVVKTQYGYHIIRRDKSQQASVKSFNEVKKEIDDMLKAREINKRVEALVAGLEKQNNVKLFVKEPAPAPAKAAPAKTLAPVKAAPKR